MKSRHLTTFFCLNSVHIRVSLCGYSPVAFEHLLLTNKGACLSRYLQSPWLCNLDWSVKRFRGKAKKKDMEKLLEQLEQHYKQREDEFRAGKTGGLEVYSHCELQWYHSNQDTWRLSDHGMRVPQKRDTFDCPKHPVCVHYNP